MEMDYEIHVLPSGAHLCEYGLHFFHGSMGEDSQREEQPSVQGQTYNKHEKCLNSKRQ